MKTVRLQGKRIALDDSMLLGSGGEGDVFSWNGRALKIFHQPTRARADKIRAFPRALPPNVLAPQDALEDERSDVVGYAMALAPSAVEMIRFGQRKWREGKLSNAEVASAFRLLHATLVSLHARGIVVGDLNDGNVLVSDLRPYLIDADSMQFGAFPCVVGHERFLDPRLFGVDLERAPAFAPGTDWYAFAVLLFTSWLYVHPFGGSHAAHRTLLRRAEARCSVLRDDVKLPPAAAHFRVLSDDMLDWFSRVFERDERGAVPEALLATRWSRCGCGTEHARARCPECARPRAAVPLARVAGGVRVVKVQEMRGRPKPTDDFQIVQEWLVRTSTGERIGRVLEGGTLVHAGERFGFGVYRAGRVAFPFLFPTRGAGLRHLKMDVPPGKIVDLETSFDGGHVLVRITADEAGRRTHGAHWIKEDGAVEVGVTGAPEACALFEAAASCAAYGSVLAATERGLLLVRPDARTGTFVEHKLFPETLPWLDGIVDLLPAPGGAVYVVKNQEILELSLA